jgi:hypothetical protein
MKPREQRWSPLLGPSVAVALFPGCAALRAGYWFMAARDASPPSVASGDDEVAVAHLAPQGTLTP